MTVTITVPDALDKELAAAVAKNGWPREEKETDAEFVKRSLEKYCCDMICGQRNKARAAVKASSFSDL